MGKQIKRRRARKTKAWRTWPHTAVCASDYACGGKGYSKSNPATIVQEKP